MTSPVMEWPSGEADKTLWLLGISTSGLYSRIRTKNPSQHAPITRTKRPIEHSEDTAKRDRTNDTSLASTLEAHVVQRYCHVLKQGELKKLVELEGNSSVTTRYCDEPSCLNGFLKFGGGLFWEAEGFDDEELRRFFSSKVLIEEAKAMNPETLFSVETPSTLMTEEEFTRFVGRSNQRGAPVFATAPSVDQEALNSTLSASTAHVLSEQRREDTQAGEAAGRTVAEKIDDDELEDRRHRVRETFIEMAKKQYIFRVHPLYLKAPEPEPTDDVAASSMRGPSTDAPTHLNEAAASAK
ncbi:hypothetical protein PsorP6_003622 [Peronosclerospora sorghi]|uniref:Uncharacterized protein n=1 Tax=Peronosclerospora sorghi TaxID=230839 RepID=A0ACC0VM42_9STRA|nr:hypothetical protein PsorP6_003622 [Peronosclerospora sorghi]